MTKIRASDLPMIWCRNQGSEGHKIDEKSAWAAWMACGINLEAKLACRSAGGSYQAQVDSTCRAKMRQYYLISVYFSDSH